MGVSFDVEFFFPCTNRGSNHANHSKVSCSAYQSAHSVQFIMEWIGIDSPIPSPSIPIHHNIVDHSSSLHSMPSLACACFFISFGVFPCGESDRSSG